MHKPRKGTSSPLLDVSVKLKVQFKLLLRKNILSNSGAAISYYHLLSVCLVYSVCILTPCWSYLLPGRSWEDLSSKWQTRKPTLVTVRTKQQKQEAD